MTYYARHLPREHQLVRRAMHRAVAFLIAFGLGLLGGSVLAGWAVRVFLWTLNMGWVLP